MVDGNGRPYFLWDMDMSLEEFRRRLAEDDVEVRVYLLAKLMRQAKPDDVFQFTTRSQIRADWAKIQPFLGHTRPFWTWLLETWDQQREHEERDVG